jgi:excisionase family DNA binding protein
MTSVQRVLRHMFGDDWWRPDPPPPEADGRIALRPREVAERLGVCDKTVQTWVKHEGFPTVKIGNTVVHPITPVRRWLADRGRELNDGNDQN